VRASRASWLGPASLVAVSAGFLTSLPCVAADPATVSSDWQTRVLAEIAAEECEITFQTGPDGQRGGWEAPNRAHNLRTWFAEDGIRVEPRNGGGVSWEWGLSLLRYGRPGQTTPVEGARLSFVENLRGALDEWYVNDPRGLEQGSTLFSRPRLDPGDREGRGAGEARFTSSPPAPLPHRPRDARHGASLDR
jgi:hypothetical protein